MTIFGLIYTLEILKTFLLNNIRETAACNPGMVFVNLQSSSII